MKKTSGLSTVIFALFLFFGVGIFFLFRYNLLGDVDSIAYLHLAEWYVDGRFWDAVEPHWSPLIAWLLTPVILLPGDHMFLFRCVTLLSGGAALFVFWKLLGSTIQTPFLRNVFTYAALPFFLFFSLVAQTPDILVVFFFTLYLYLFVRNDKQPSDKTAVAIGVCAGVGYLAKSYFFPFFLAHFAFMHVVMYWQSHEQEQRKQLVRRFAVGLVSFLLVVSPWITLLSVKTGHLTISSASEYNLRLVNPEIYEPSLNNHFPHPMHTEGLIAPVVDGATSVWDTPYYILPYMDTWKVFTVSNLPHFIERISNNLTLAVLSVATVSPLLLFVFLMVSIFFLFKKFGSLTSPTMLLERHEFISLLLFSSILIYVGGYVLLVVEGRYLWPIFVFMLVFIGYVLDESRRFFEYVLYKPVVVLILFMIAVGPIYALSVMKGMNTYYEFVSYHSALLKKELALVEGELIASNKNWHLSLHIAHQLGEIYYGETRDDASSELSDVLLKHNIKYYFYWGEADGSFGIEKYTPVFTDNENSLTIWKRQDFLLDENTI